MRSMQTLTRSMFILTLAVGAAACGPEPLEVAGEWDDSFGGSSTISDTAWDAMTVAKFDNEANWAVVQNPADDEFSPNTFAKLVWTEEQDASIWLCWVDFGKATAAEAENTTNTTDASNPGESGCGDFSWTKMTRKAAK